MEMRSLMSGLEALKQHLTIIAKMQISAMRFWKLPVANLNVYRSLTFHIPSPETYPPAAWLASAAAVDD